MLLYCRKCSRTTRNQVNSRQHWSYKFTRLKWHIHDNCLELVSISEKESLRNLFQSCHELLEDLVQLINSSGDTIHLRQDTSAVLNREGKSIFCHVGPGNHVRSRWQGFGIQECAISSDASDVDVSCVGLCWIDRNYNSEIQGVNCKQARDVTRTTWLACLIVDIPADRDGTWLSTRIPKIKPTTYYCSSAHHNETGSKVACGRDDEAIALNLVSIGAVVLLEIVVEVTIILALSCLPTEQPSFQLMFL
jgi:hypothetical protein